MQQIDELLKELQEERADNTRLIRALDNSERYAYNCAKQAGDLAEGVAAAIGMSYSTVVPDDKNIIAAVARTCAELELARELLAEAGVALEGVIGHSVYGRLASASSTKLAARIKTFLGEGNENGDTD